MTQQSDQISTVNVHVVRGPKTSALAIVSLVFAILGIFAAFIVPIISQVVSIICGHIARSQIRKDPEKIGGDGLALAGLIISYVVIAINIGSIVLVGSFIASF